MGAFVRHYEGGFTDCTNDRLASCYDAARIRVAPTEDQKHRGTGRMTKVFAAKG